MLTLVKLIIFVLKVIALMEVLFMEQDTVFHTVSLKIDCFSIEYLKNKEKRLMRKNFIEQDYIFIWKMTRKAELI